MTLEGTFIDHHTCHLPDVNGFQAQIPLVELHAVARQANQCDDGRAYYRGRFQAVGHWFGRDALNGAVDLAFPVCDQCHENPASQDMGDGNHFCPDCCSAAQGSRYDDRIEF